MFAGYSHHPEIWNGQLGREAFCRASYPSPVLVNPRDANMHTLMPWISRATPHARNLNSTQLSRLQYSYQVNVVPPMSLSPIVERRREYARNTEVTGSTVVQDSRMFSNRVASELTKPSGSKRGRPRAEVISTLQYVGSNSNCTIQCHICNRIFPREKSLQAHLRTHTGERPYRCDYPACNKSFVQSGQLKTHQRLHSGEKPFRCSQEGCKVRFTHANRHCAQHPHAKLNRDDDGALARLKVASEQKDPMISTWFNTYIANRLQRNSLTQRNCTTKNLSHRNRNKDKIEINATKRTHGSQPHYSANMLDETSAEVACTCAKAETTITSPSLSCQPVKKRILAYSKRLLKSEEQENINRIIQIPIQPLHPIVTPNFRILNEKGNNSTERFPFEESVEGYSFVTELESAALKDNISESIPINSGNNTKRPERCMNVNSHTNKLKCTEEQSRWNSAVALIQLASNLNTE